MSALYDILGTIVGEIVGMAAGSAKKGLEDYNKYTSSGQYDDDYSTGNSRASGMSDKSLYKEMSNKNRSAGERIAYKDELKKRGY